MEEENTGSGMKHRRLYKSAGERVVDGVCGGLGQYFGVDAAVVRLLFVAFAILSVGAGVVFYIVGMAVIPVEPVRSEDPQDTNDGSPVPTGGGTITLVLGIIIIVIGVSLLFNYYEVVPVTAVFSQFGRLALPIIIILIGGALLLGGERKREAVEGGNANEDSEKGVEKKRLARSIRDKKIAGVCGGLAHYLDVDPTIVRLVFAAISLASFGLALVLYIVCAFIIPKEID